MYSNNSEFSRVYDNFKCPYEKSLETYHMHQPAGSYYANQINLNNSKSSEPIFKLVHFHP